MTNRSVCVVVLLVMAVTTRLAAADATDRSLSPYFFVEGSAPGVDALPLKRTEADVHVSGVIAEVVVRQTYRNDGDQTLSARYVFPASTRAAVHGMQMRIGDRLIEAKIKEREEARREYEEAKSAGKTASLLEEDRPNVFSMSVANIVPGDEVEVELRYTELLVPTEGVYELVYPTVVGPRYASASSDVADVTNRFLASPYLRAGTRPTSTFDLEVALAGGMKLHGIESPSHAIRTALAAGDTEATVTLADRATGGDRDFVLRYQLAGDDLASGMLLYPGKGGEGFFLLMVQPPRRPALELIPPREYVFIIDVSGSMHGFPLDTTKALMKDLLGRLRPTDHFNVLLFSGGSSLYSETSVPAEPARIADAVDYVTREKGGGGTELLPALERAMKLPAVAPHVSRSFVVVTDGYISEEARMFEHVRANLGRANVFSFGIGSSVNRHLTDGLAHAGRGEPFVVLSPMEAAAAAARFRAYVEAPVLTDVKVAFDGFDAHDVEPASIPDVFASRPVVVFGKYRGAPRGKVTLTGVSGRGRFVSTLDVGAMVPDDKHAALPYLWAREKIRELSDFTGDANKAEVTALGLRYNLLTRYTSFIAVSHVVRAAGRSVDVDQPLPMPAGVSDLAVGGGVEVGFEPGLGLLLGLVALGLGLRLLGGRRRYPRVA